jgi:tol-pal system protein YbgF
MVWRPLLPSAGLAVGLGLAVFVAPAPVHSQDRSTHERLDRLERDLNMLQRQVYRGAPPPLGGDRGAAVNAEIRMERLEAQMRDLTGHVEEVMNKIVQVRQRIEQINSDVEVRFNRLGVEGGTSATVAAKSVPARLDAVDAGRQFPPEPADAADEVVTPPRLALSTGSGSPMVPGTMVPPPGGSLHSGLTSTSGTLTPPGSTARAAELASAAPAGHPAAGLLPSGSTTAQYNHAFGLLKQANYPAAEAAFKAFLAQHPKDPMAGNAQYWLGETYYTRARYLDAASAFAEGYKRYPKSAKAADDLLKLGMSLARANQKQNACLVLTQLGRDFPHPGAAIKAHAAAEKKRLGC